MDNVNNQTMYEDSQTDLLDTLLNSVRSQTDSLDSLTDSNETQTNGLDSQKDSFNIWIDYINT